MQSALTLGSGSQSVRRWELQLVLQSEPPLEL
jgi:hypothetical protein